jgi:hypothetical protein
MEKNYTYLHTYMCVGIAQVFCAVISYLSTVTPRSVASSWTNKLVWGKTVSCDKGKANRASVWPKTFEESGNKHFLLKSCPERVLHNLCRYFPLTFCTVVTRWSSVSIINVVFRNTDRCLTCL